MTDAAASLPENEREELRERFERSILEFETAPEVLPFSVLHESGFRLLPPEDVTESELHSTLHSLIAGLAGIGLYLYHTDHLSDRELYGRLWSEVLLEPVVLMPHIRGFACHVDMAARDGEEDYRLYLRYYADEQMRRSWHEECPDCDVPPHEDPPFDRDRTLPVPYYWRVS